MTTRKRKWVSNCRLVHRWRSPKKPLKKCANVSYSLPQVKSVYTTIGGGSAGSDPSMPQASAETRMATDHPLTARGERPRKGVIEKQIRQMLSDMPGMRVKVGLGASGEKYLVMLTGDDPSVLQQTATAF
jgi:hypothetical protein